jgi:hypothetical protein
MRGTISILTTSTVVLLLGSSALAGKPTTLESRLSSGLTGAKQVVAEIARTHGAVRSANGKWTGSRGHGGAVLVRERRRGVKEGMRTYVFQRGAVPSSFFLSELRLRTRSTQTRLRDGKLASYLRDENGGRLPGGLGVIVKVPELSSHVDWIVDHMIELANEQQWTVVVKVDDLLTAQPGDERAVVRAPHSLKSLESLLHHMQTPEGRAWIAKLGIDTIRATLGIPAPR